MTHFDVDYSQYKGPARTIKALNDLLEYLGPEKYNQLVVEAKHVKRNFVKGCFHHLLGVSGVPVTEFLNMYCGPEEVANNG